FLASAKGANRKVPPGIVSRCEERKPLDMVPVKVSQGEEHRPHLLVAAGDQVLAQVPNATARIQNHDLAGLTREHYTGRVAPKILKLPLANRDRAARAVELRLGFHAVPPRANAPNRASRMARSDYLRRRGSDRLHAFTEGPTGVRLLSLLE